VRQCAPPACANCQLPQPYQPFCPPLAPLHNTNQHLKQKQQQDAALRDEAAADADKRASAVRVGVWDAAKREVVRPLSGGAANANRPQQLQLPMTPLEQWEADKPVMTPMRKLVMIGELEPGPASEAGSKCNAGSTAINSNSPPTAAESSAAVPAPTGPRSASRPAPIKRPSRLSLAIPPLQPADACCTAACASPTPAADGALKSLWKFLDDEGMEALPSAPPACAAAAPSPSIFSPLSRARRLSSSGAPPAATGAHQHHSAATSPLSAMSSAAETPQQQQQQLQQQHVPPLRHASSGGGRQRCASASSSTSGAKAVPKASAVLPLHHVSFGNSSGSHVKHQPSVEAGSSKGGVRKQQTAAGDEHDAVSDLLHRTPSGAPQRPPAGGGGSSSFTSGDAGRSIGVHAIARAGSVSSACGGRLQRGAMAGLGVASGNSPSAQ